MTIIADGCQFFCFVFFFCQTLIDLVVELTFKAKWCTLTTLNSLAYYNIIGVSLLPPDIRSSQQVDS